MINRLMTLSFMATVGAILFALVHLTLGDAVNRVIVSDSEREARNWATFLADTMPDLSILIQTGRPDDIQQEFIRDVATFGEVFRFKLFNQAGDLVLMSDKLGLPLDLSSDAGHSGFADDVLRTGEAHIDVVDGRDMPGRPDLFVEAYVPVLSETGHILGVVEVYLDQTRLEALFTNTFVTLAIGLGIILAAAFGVPFAAYVVKMQQYLRSGEQVQFLSSMDPLTGLHNRTTFFQVFEQRRKSEKLDVRKMAVIYMDIDRFKAINDTFGHKIGDAFLRHVGNAISSCRDAGDIAARIGGDEFVLLSFNRSSEQLHRLVETLRATVSEPVRLDGIAITGHLSLGVHYDEAAQLSLDDRIHKADIALYQAKIDGRNTWALFTPDLEERIAYRKYVEECVLRGLSEQTFQLYFQPLIDTRTGEVGGFEALLRLQDEKGVFIPPSDFIPVAEEAGEISRIGEWVLREATVAASLWPEHLGVSVNLSARQFADERLVAIVRDALDASGLDPTRLELEVTENVLIEQGDAVAAQLDALRAFGVSLAMDDFGTGYSSLGYLWQFSFDKLKIDRSFIQSADGISQKSKHILETILMLGHKLGMTITVEGIEHAAQDRALRALPFDFLQGFYYGKPMPAEDLPAFILSNVMTRRHFETGEALVGENHRA